MIRLDGGVAEALHYMRRPIATLAGGETPVVLARFAPAERVDSDSPALTEVFLHYPDAGLVVLTATNGSPLLKYVGQPNTWVSFAAQACATVLGAPAPDTDHDALARARDGAVSIGGVKHQALTHHSASNVLTWMAVAPTGPGEDWRGPAGIVVAVAGAPDAVEAAELTLATPDRELVTAVYFGGQYPRYGSAQPPADHDARKVP